VEVVIVDPVVAAEVVDVVEVVAVVEILCSWSSSRRRSRFVAAAVVALSLPTFVCEFDVRGVVGDHKD